jgi:mRNA interferase MazF
MVTGNYIPDRGDLVWLEFTPQSGHEQAGRRPALIISPLSYNRRTGLCLAFPITSHIKGYPFEVPIDTLKVKGVVLSDQAKNLDWKVRNASFIDKVEEEIINEAVQLFSTLII